MKIVNSKKRHNFKRRYLAMSIVSTLSLFATPMAQGDIGAGGNIKQIGDLEIYSQATGSTAPRVLLMLDLSASMWRAPHPDKDKRDPAAVNSSIPNQPDVPFNRRFYAVDPNTQQPPNGCKDKFGGNMRPYSMDKSYTYTDPASGKSFTVTLPTQYNAATNPDGNPIYGLSGCENPDSKSNGDKDANGNITFNRSKNRLHVLKDALLTMLTDDTLSNNVEFGIMTYSGNTIDPQTGKINKIDRDNNSGIISVPVKPLTFEHRKRLAQEISWFSAHSGTPIAPALAEAGAYMMGTTTLNRNKPLTGQSNLLNGGNIIPPERFGIIASSQRHKDVTTAYTSTGVNRTFNPATDSYIKGGNAECGARNGIYLMTDGLPARSGPDVLFAMNNSLQGSSYKDDKGNIHPMSNSNLDLSDTSVGLEDFNFGSNGWNGPTGYNLMSRYAKRLNEGKTPGATSIQVATGGLGSLFSGMTYKWATDRRGNRYKDYQCDAVLYQVDGKTVRVETTGKVNNLCKLGRRKGEYGQGGFTPLTDSQSIINSIADFIGNQPAEIDTKPSGTIVVPQDPLSTTGPQPIAYLPMMEATPNSTDSVWKGNIKKYRVENGTLYGKDKNNNISLLFDNVLDSANLNPATRDYWSDKNYPAANAKADNGGFYTNLRTPFSEGGGIASARTVYVEDNGTLKQFSVNAAGKVLVDGSTLSNSSFANTSLYNVDMIKKLLMFLGFDQVKGDFSKKEYTIPSIPVAVSTLDLFNKYLSLMPPSKAIRTLGGSPHSAPVTVSYGADAVNDPDTKKLKYENRDDYMLFGSMDGALHLVDADDYGVGDGGKEKFAILTETMLTAQPDAIVPNSTSGGMGVPFFGVDAPWIVKQNLKDEIRVDDQGNLSGSVSSEGSVIAYGGFRMGAEGLYAIDITNANKSSDPRIKFKINPQTTGFSRLGQIWSQPTIAKIRQSDAKSDKGTEVLIFGGGYDTCYEAQEFQIGNFSFADGRLRDQRGEQCRNKSQAIGNAVYIVNAETGDLIWSTDDVANNDQLKNSIVGGIAALDANNDGYVNHIYFADLGGQLFRVDFLNAGDDYKKSSAVEAKVEKAKNFSAFRMTRLYKDKTANKKYVRRFYGEPAVSIQQDASYNDGELFASINIASGDRSSPLSKLRREKQYADRVYGILDTDITKPRDQLFDPKFTGMNDKNITLINLDDTRVDIATDVRTSEQVRSKVRATNGWFYPFTNFDGYANVFFTKAVGGKSEILANSLYLSVYNPNMGYGKDASAMSDKCTSSVIGGSEVKRYCLPFGVCDGGSDSVTKDGVGGYERLGKGIQELIMGPRGSSPEQRSQLMVLGVEPFDSSKRVKKEYGKSGPNQSVTLGEIQKTVDGLSPVTINNSVPRVPPAPKEAFYTLIPEVWYNSSVVDEEEKETVNNNE